MTTPTCPSYLPCGGAKAPTSISPPPPMTADFTTPNGSKPVEEKPPQNHVEDEDEDEDADEDAAPENGGANGMRSIRAFVMRAAVLTIARAWNACYRRRKEEKEKEKAEEKESWVEAD
jgi:hypothetical protein